MLRVYLFALPFVALLASSSLFDSTTASMRSWPRTTVLILVSAGLLRRKPHRQVRQRTARVFQLKETLAATRELYRLARPGASLSPAREPALEVQGVRRVQVPHRRGLGSMEACRKDQREYAAGPQRGRGDREKRRAGRFLSHRDSEPEGLSGRFRIRAAGFALTVPASSRTLAGFPTRYTSPDGVIFVLRKRDSRR